MSVEACLILPDPITKAFLYMFIQSSAVHQHLTQHRSKIESVRPDQPRLGCHLHPLALFTKRNRKLLQLGTLYLLIGIEIIIHISVFDLQHRLVLINVVHHVIFIFQVAVAMVGEHFDTAIFKHHSGNLTFSDCPTQD